jgi:hypothetical protein
MPLKVKDRPYNSDTLRELMYDTAGWAQGWEDVLWYLRTAAPHDHQLYQREHVQALVADIEHLRRTGARFTSDYRDVYKEITGQECFSCRPPRAAPAHTPHLRHLAEKWLVGLRFPATKEEATERARHTHAPEEVVNALQQLQEPSYASVGVVLHEVWTRARRGSSLSPHA